MKIAILSNVNIDLLESELKSKFGKDVKIFVGRFNQYAQELLNSDSEFYKFSPDIAFIHLEGFSLFYDLILNPFSTDNLEERVNAEAEQFLNLLNQSIPHLPSTLFIVSNIVIPPKSLLNSLNYNSSLSLHLVEQIFNDMLVKFKLSTGFNNLLILDWKSTVFSQGYSKLYDKKYWYLGRIPFNKTGFKLLAEEIYSLYKAYKGKIKKVIVVDLDNTLWGGIIGEDGIEGIKLGEDGIGKAYRDFQFLLKSIKNKGVVLAIVSKNNEEDVKEVFEKHPMMVLKLEDFVATRINWRPKSQNIEEIAQELNLGLDSFVFIDDNPAERLEVKNAIPQINVPDFPEDPTKLFDWFLDISKRYFDKIYITREDKIRSELYKAEAKRRKFSAKFKDLSEYLKSLEMKLLIAKNHRLMIPRIAQLTQRTNQFNLTTRRYTEADIKKFMESPNKMVYDVEVIDRFGTNGIVGVVIVNLKGREAYIDVFLLSCRVIGREVEKGFISYVIKDLKSNFGIKKIIGEYIPTPKNAVCKDTYKNLGFRLVEITQDGRSIWEFDVETQELNPPSWLKIQKRSERDET